MDAVGGALFSFAWSLAAEEQFYMIWPWVEKYLSNTMAVVVMLSVVLFIYHVRATGFEPHSVGGIIVFRIMPAICFGVLAAHALDNKRAFTALHSIVGGRYANLVLLIGVIGYLSLENNNFLLTHFLMAVLVTSCVIREDHLLNSLLRTRLLVVGGTISYGMYLMHMLTMHLVEGILHKVGTDNVLLVFIGTVVSSMVLAFISYRYYESYFLNLKRKFKATAPHPAGANALLK